MKRLTDPRLAMPPGEWREVTLEERKKLQEIPVPPVTDLYYRLASIEDILGDEYDIERLRNLVEADKLLGKNVYLSRNELLELYTLKDPALNETGVVPLPVIRQNIMDMPAADVVEVVRCRDCVYGFALQSCPGVLYCRVTAETTPADGFCHNGGRSNAN